MIKRNQMLAQWIEYIGVKKLSTILGVDVSTVQRWREGSRFPESTHLKIMVELSKGYLKYDQLYYDWFAACPIVELRIKKAIKNLRLYGDVRGPR